MVPEDFEGVPVAWANDDDTPVETSNSPTHAMSASRRSVVIPFTIHMCFSPCAAMATRLSGNRVRPFTVLRFDPPRSALGTGLRSAGSTSAAWMIGTRLGLQPVGNKTIMAYRNTAGIEEIVIGGAGRGSALDALEPRALGAVLDDQATGLEIIP